jgi:hypothetical protein
MNEKKKKNISGYQERKLKKSKLTAALSKITGYFNSNNYDLLPSKL